MQIHDDFFRLFFLNSITTYKQKCTEKEKVQLAVSWGHPLEQNKCQSSQGHLQCDQTQKLKMVTHVCLKYEIILKPWYLINKQLQ